MQPNLFDYATKELSQDAMISYMLKWADDKYKNDESSHQIGKRFLDAIFKKYEDKIKDIPSKYSIEIKKQEKNIDILCIVNEEYYIIIEDKTNTSHHGDQLNKYFKYVNTTLDVEEDNILCIYYKTGEEYNLDKLSGKTDKNKKWEYKPFLKDDIFKVLDINTTNQIFLDYKKHISKLIKKADYKKLPLEEWETDTWIHFARELKKENKLNLGDKITHAKGSNQGLFFNYKEIKKDKIGFYLRISFNKRQIEFKLENEGSNITKALATKYYNLIEESKPDNFKIKKAKFSSAKNNMIIASVEEYCLIENNKILDFNKSKDFIKSILLFHNKIINKIEED